MKVFIAILALVACVSAEWTPKTAEEIKGIRGECLKDNPLSDEYIGQMKNFIFPNEEPVRKYLMCTAIKMDIFCEHEGYHADRVAKQFKMDMEESEVLPIAQDCVDKNPKVDGQPADVWAFKGHQCMMAGKVGDKVRAYIKKRQEVAAAANAQ